jgi:hypothetical protein
MGGLGNQMFQYAAGRRLSFARKTQLKLDPFLLGDASPDCTPRHYELGAFGIHDDFVTEEEIRLFGLRGEASQSLFNRYLEKFAFIRPEQAVFRERFFHFDPDVLCLPENICLIGYWQSEKYFADIEDIIRTEFRVKHPLKGLNQELAEQIRETESVSVHVRRGDYISNQVTKAFHPACRIEYYHRAINDAFARKAFYITM